MAKEVTKRSRTQKKEEKRERDRWYHIKKKYGLSKEDWGVLFNSQNGLCAICHRTQDSLKKNRIKRFCVDHDHKTGKIRGLLCSNCNYRILSALRDRIDLAQNVVTYLQKAR